MKWIFTIEAAVFLCDDRDVAPSLVETATHDVVKQGLKLNFPQVFIFETANGRITRMQAYEPYGPHGIMGLFLFVVRLKNRVLRK